MQSLYLNRLTGISMPNFAGFFSGLWNLQARVESMFTLDKSNPFSFIDNIGKQKGVNICHTFLHLNQ